VCLDHVARVIVNANHGVMPKIFIDSQSRHHEFRALAAVVGNQKQLTRQKHQYEQIPYSHC
jgi:hypothetical protein